MYRSEKMQRVIKGLVLGAVAALSGVAATADEDWISLPTSAPSITFSIDKASVVRQGKRVTFWENITFEKSEVKDDASGSTIKEKKVKRIMDCEDHSQGVISGATFGENGRFITSVEFSAAQIRMTAIPAGTLAAQELDLVCVADSKK
jgi:hypothetical protein